jgi:TRAP-type mannitol/chloroaromatic compound transport system permease small subunit
MIARLANGIDRGVDALGRALSWLTLILVVLSFGLVLARYALGIGSIKPQAINI